jgi:predicted ATPase/DNA-binding CsgD family transcriptional regulator
MGKRNMEYTVPRFPTSLVGREQEVEELCELVAGSRFVVVAGPGGAGKSRLAAAVVEKLLERFNDGAIVVDVERVVSPPEVRQRVAAAIGVRDSHTATAELLATALRRRRILLVLDNCESLEHDSLRELQELLDEAEALSVLATSRKALHLAGGYVFTLAPLPVPPDDAFSARSAAATGRYDAVRLFVDRARLVRPSFALTDENAASVSAICRHLDGLPLAIELAASWMRVLSVLEIVARIEHGPRFPRAGTGTFASRHQSLESIVADTYSLCTTEEQLLWSRMTVFEGSFDLTAVESVCGAAPLDEPDLLDTVNALVDRSVLSVDQSGTRSRYRLLRVVRNYAAARIDDLATVEERHRVHFAAVVEAAARNWLGPEQVGLSRDLRHAYPDIVRAIERGLEGTATVSVSMRMAVDLWPFWFTSGRLTEGRRLMARVAVTPDGNAHVTERARVLRVVAYLCVLQGDLAAARSFQTDAFQLLDDVDEPFSRAMGSHVEAIIQMCEDGWQTAGELLDQAAAVYAESDDTLAPVFLIDAIGLAAASAALSGQSQRANELGRRGLEICTTQGDVVWRAYIQYALGVDAWLQGACPRASSYATEAMESSPDELLVTLCIELLAWCEASTGGYESAARLLGTAEHRWSYLGGPFSGFKELSRHHDRCERAARSALRPAAFDAAHEQGATFDAADVVKEVASAGEPVVGGVASRDRDAAPLTARQLEVARLLAEGLSNRQIATVLRISTRTAESHVDHILTKLDLPNRTSVAGWFLQRAGERGPGDRARLGVANL